MPNTDGGMDRRALLRSAVVATGAAAMAGAVATAPAQAQKAVSSTDDFDQTAGPQFFSDASLNFMTLIAFASAGTGTAEFGEVATIVAETQRRDSSYRAFAESCISMAQRVGARARAANKAGHRVTAADTFLRASNYYSNALFFALAFPGEHGREVELYDAMESNLAASLKLGPYRSERVHIPYERTTMPAWFIAPAGPKRQRPTILFVNGSDATNTDLYGFGGAAAAVRRGYNALILEGPGQGEMLFIRRIPFRPDWEKVTTPVITWLRARSDVDAKRIAMWGWSFGGYLVPRSLAYGPDLAAGVVDPAVNSYIASWPQAVIQTGFSGDKAAVDAEWNNFLANAGENLSVLLRKRLEIFVQPSWYEAVREMQKYELTAAQVARINTPMLVTQAEEEQFWPGESQTVFDQLTGVRDKELTTFTAADGSQYHCEPMAPQHRAEVILDWLAAGDRLGG